MPLFSALPVHRDITQSAATVLDKHAPASLVCDVSFVSDDATPAVILLERELIRQADAQAAGLLSTIYESLRSTYDGGSFIPHRASLRPIIARAIQTSGLAIDGAELDALVIFFDHLNQVMFQHQTIGWLIDSEFQVHLYGNHWHSHPTFSRFARGPIESDAMRLAVYRASRINLAASINGVVDPRLSEGIGAGGFFLVRFCPADLVERIFPPLWDFCSQRGITTNAQLDAQATPSVRTLLDFASHTIGTDVLDAWPDFVGTLRESADAGYVRNAAAIWPEYPAVAFDSRDELIGLVSRYLYDGTERQRLADAMRRQLIGRFEHVRVNRRALSNGPHASPDSSEVAA